MQKHAQISNSSVDLDQHKVAVSWGITAPTFRLCLSDSMHVVPLRSVLREAPTCPCVFVLLQENQWDSDARYDCPDGFYHASTAQVRRL